MHNTVHLHVYSHTFTCCMWPIFIAPHTSPMNIGFPIEYISDVSFVVQWDPVNNQSVDRYIITVNWTDGTNPIQTATVNETSYNVTGLSPNTTYAVNVAVVNECGIGVPCADGRVTTSASPSMNSVSTTYTSVFLRLIPTATTTTTTTTTTSNASASTTTATHLMPIFNTINPAACITSKF